MSTGQMKIGDISDVSGEVIIAGGDVVKGFTAEQVSVLLTQITTTFEPKKFDGHCPYKGLDVFEEEDAELFFGRERLVDDLVSRVKDSRTVFVTGPSGSGKSSLVRAGLMHALKQGAVKDLHSERWLYATMKPGRDPLGELARVTAGLAGSTNAEDEVRAKALTDATIFARWCEIALKDGRDKRAVLFIDQFEEVFTQISKDAERVVFLNLLTHAATVENGRVIILFSMRSDFVSNCATYPQLNNLLNQQFIQIGAMQPDELVSAIAQPALRVGLRIDPDLIAQIINDMQGEPGALPLMQFALKDLFDAGQVKGGIIALTLRDYLERGGIRKALERHADDSFAKLNQHEQELARSIFSGLIEIGRGTQDTKRTALFNELIPASAQSAEVEAIVRKLADARLITTDEAAGKDTVTISHEKLIDAWPWLKKLVNENRDVIALQNEITADAKEWEEHERDASYLYTGARLINAREKLEAKKLIVSGLAQQYIEIGIEQEVIKRKEEDKRRQKERALISVTVAMVVSIALAIMAVISGISALRQSQKALASLLAAQSIALVNTLPDLSILLSLEANFIGDELGESDPAWLGSLVSDLNSSPKLGTFLHAHQSEVRALTFSPDGHWLATAGGLPIDDGKNGEVYLWDMSSGTNHYQKLNIGDTDRILGVAFSADSKTLAAAGNGKVLFVWNTDQCCDPIQQPIPLPDKVSTIKFVTLNEHEYLAIAINNQVTFWDPTNWTMQADLTLTIKAVSPSIRILSLAFSPTTHELASGSEDGAITVWNLDTREEKFHLCSYYRDPAPIGSSPCDVVDNYVNEIRGLAFNSDASMLISGSSDQHAWLWNMQNGDLLAITPDANEGGHINTVTSVAFNPKDEAQVATVSWDNTVRLWNLIHTENDTWSFYRTDTLAGHANSIWAVAYSPDGKWLASGSSDKSVILWKVNQINQIGTPLAQMQGDVWALAVSPHGDQLAAGDAAGNIRIWKFDGKVLTELRKFNHPDGVLTLTYSHNGNWLASAGYDKTIIVWDVQTGKEAWRIENAHDDQIWALTFSPDDHILASASFDSTAKLWDTASHQLMSTLQHKQGVSSLTFNDTGTQLLVAGFEPDIYRWDLTDPASLPKPDLLTGHLYSVSSLSYNPKFPPLLASTSEDKTLLIWNTNSAAHTPPVLGLNESMEAVTFRPSGDWLASATNNNTVLLWQLDSQRCAEALDQDTCQPDRLGDPLVGHQTPVENVVFLSDTAMVSSSQDGQLIFWNLNKSYWYQKACNIVNRPFSDSEYSQYISGKINTTLLSAVNWLSDRFGSGSTEDPPSCIGDSLP